MTINPSWPVLDAFPDRFTDTFGIPLEVADDFPDVFPEEF